MRLRSKSYLFIGGATLVLVAVSLLAFLYAFRSFSITTVGDQGQMAAKLVLGTLTQEMMSGNMENHESLIAGLKKTPGLMDIEIIPSEIIIKQFGQRPGDIHEPSLLEKQAMETGRVAEKLDETRDRVIYHVAIPYIATSKGEVNCMQCHDVSEGTVLGAVGLSIDITEQREGGIIAVALVAGLILLFGGFMAIALKRLLNPVVDTTEQLHTVVGMAEQGDFSGRLAKRSNDEIGAIADQTNRLMAALESSLGNIFKEVKTLTKYTAGTSEKNLLKYTVEVVRNMVGAARFKQMAESDRDLGEVYKRLHDMLAGQFGLKRFSLYEVSNSKNRLRLIFAEGLPEGSNLWCEAEIMTEAEACRAKRTGLAVSSIEEADICASFCGNRIQDKQNLIHVCLPMLLSGSIGGVLQIIFAPEEADEVQAILSTIQTYLDEITPVVETKRLMASLRESAMRDAMTGLYNRRFLEEYLDTFTADVARRAVPVGVLMCDVDFFKPVNDALGHEIGDSVLKGMAVILKQSVRASDLVIRYGGEEFLALLINADEEKTLEIAERVRAAVEANTFPTASGPLSKTLSIGVAMYPADNEGFWGCVKFADVALYQAKETGRNKVLRFTKDMWKEDDQV